MKEKDQLAFLISGKSGGGYLYLPTPKYKIKLTDAKNGITLKFNGRILFMPDFISTASFVTNN